MFTLVESLDSNKIAISIKGFDYFYFNIAEAIELSFLVIVGFAVIIQNKMPNL